MRTCQQRHDNVERVVRDVLSYIDTPPKTVRDMAFLRLCCFRWARGDVSVGVQKPCRIEVSGVRAVNFRVAVEVLTIMTVPFGMNMSSYQSSSWEANRVHGPPRNASLTMARM